MNAPDRRAFIGGSDAAAVLGISPWKTPLQLWQEKTQLAMPESLDADRARVLTRGKRMEPYVVELLAEETGLRIVRRNERYVDAEFPFLAAEIDAEAETGESVEIKTVSPFKARDWGELDSDEIPVHYTAQAQHGLMVTGRAVCVFGVLIGGDDFRTYRVERDDEIIEAIRAAEVRFWREHVETLQPPPPSTLGDLAALFPQDLGEPAEATEATLAAVVEMRSLAAQAGEITDRIDKCKATIQKHMGTASRLTHLGLDIATWKTQVSRRFDQTAFKKAHPDLFEQFTASVKSRVFRLR